MPQTADRILLLGILALQTDFITRDALIAAMLASSVAKHRPLENILVDDPVRTVDCHVAALRCRGELRCDRFVEPEHGRHPCEP
jgi:hypothetical protein